MPEISFTKNLGDELGVVAQVSNPSTGEGKGRQLSYESEASLLYKISSRTARSVTQRNLSRMAEGWPPGFAEDTPLVQLLVERTTAYT